nr:MAG TPA: hypothetical protein [Bacteriophage sp.]
MNNYSITSNYPNVKKKFRENQNYFIDSSKFLYYY